VVAAALPRQKSYSEDPETTAWRNFFARKRLTLGLWYVQAEISLRGPTTVKVWRVRGSELHRLRQLGKANQRLNAPVAYMADTRRLISRRKGRTGKKRLQPAVKRTSRMTISGRPFAYRRRSGLCPLAARMGRQS
jgi:hypothetical protein